MSDSVSATNSTTENRYFVLKASGLQRAKEDDFSTACFEIGAAGVSEILKFSQQDLRYEPDVVETPILDVNVYFTEAPGESLLLQLQAQFPSLQIELTSEENKDWMAEWKKGFKPFRFAGPFWVIPSWLTPPPEAGSDKTKHIYVEPGMAFGTGTHETTRLAAQLILEEVVRSHPKTLLDVGTGTAILALIAYRLGVQKLVGLDNDPEARRTARENLERNQAEAIAIPDTNLEDEKNVYDVVVANIIDGVLTILRTDLVRTLKVGGRMVVSGVLLEREVAFYESFCKDSGLKLIKKISEGEWSAAILEKQA
jgi:ribosomal protein L11 methyltransferase